MSEYVPVEAPPWLVWAARHGGGDPATLADGSPARDGELPFGRSTENLLRVVAPELGAAYDDGRIDAERLVVYVEETGPFPDAVVAATVRGSLDVAPSMPPDELREDLADLIDELAEAHDALLLEAMTCAAGEPGPATSDPATSDPDPGAGSDPDDVMPIAGDTATGRDHSPVRSTPWVGTTSLDGSRTAVRTVVARCPQPGWPQPPSPRREVPATPPHSCARAPPPQRRGFRSARGPRSSDDRRRGRPEPHDGSDPADGGATRCPGVVTGEDAEHAAAATLTE